MKDLSTTSVFGMLIGLTGASVLLGLGKLGTDRTYRRVGLLPAGTARGTGWRGRDRATNRPASRPALLGASVALGVSGGTIGVQLAGPPGFLLAGAAAIPLAVRRRNIHRSAEALERQLAELTEAVAMGVKSGLSVPQAIDSAADDLGSPMSVMVRRMIDEQRLGMPFDRALGSFADALGTEDALLFRLVVAVHARSGGNLAGALREVTATIRHRIAVRRELRSLSAQGRISGAILGSLPIGFFLVVAASSHRQLAPVYGSPAGLAMITVGFAMEALAFLWIRRLLRVRI